jgi:hypothetical protein
MDAPSLNLPNYNNHQNDIYPSSDVTPVYGRQVAWT